MILIKKDEGIWIESLIEVLSKLDYGLLLFSALICWYVIDATISNSFGILSF